MSEPIGDCLTKANLVDLVYGELNIDKPHATELVEAWIELIKKGLEDDGKVMISGFGVFEVKRKKARIGRNPQTGEKITLPGRQVIKFKTSQVLRKHLNRSLPRTQEEEESRKSLHSDSATRESVSGNSDSQRQGQMPAGDSSDAES